MFDDIGAVMKFYELCSSVCIICIRPWITVDYVFAWNSSWVFHTRFGKVLLQSKRCKIVDWIHLTQHTVQWRALMKAVMNLHALRLARNQLTSDATWWYPRTTHASVVPLRQPRNSTVESEMSSLNEMWQCCCCKRRWSCYCAEHKALEAVNAKGKWYRSRFKTVVISLSAT